MAREVRKTAVEAQKLKNEAKFDEQTHGVDALIARYRDLAAGIEAASKAAQDAERQASAALNAQRNQEDAALSLREEQEVAALDRNDPAYGEKVRQIRQRYSGARNLLGAQRAVEVARDARPYRAGRLESAPYRAGRLEIGGAELSGQKFFKIPPCAPRGKYDMICAS